MLKFRKLARNDQFPFESPFLVTLKEFTAKVIYVNKRKLMSVGNGYGNISHIEA